jgi:hypothetical protein
LQFKDSIVMMIVLNKGNSAPNREQRGAKLARTLAIILACSILVTLALVMGCSSSEEIIMTPQREPGTVRGVVTSVVADQPLPYTKVHIISSPFVGGNEGETVSAITFTDENGWYNYNIPHGKIVVVVTKDGYKKPDAKMWSLSPGGDGRLDFVLVPGEDTDEIDPRIHDAFCLTCHYQYLIPDPDSDGQEAYPPEGTGKGGPGG